MTRLDCGCEPLTEHAPGCDGNHWPHDGCDGDELPEVWCRRCPAAAVGFIDGEAYCAVHASIERWKRAAPSWRMQR